MIPELLIVAGAIIFLVVYKTERARSSMPQHFSVMLEGMATRIEQLRLDTEGLAKLEMAEEKMKQETIEVVSQHSRDIAEIRQQVDKIQAVMALKRG